jgi:hypothetical protein
MTPHDPPANLFQDSDAQPSFPVKARGHTGNHLQAADKESDTTRLVSAMIPLITSLSQNVATQLQTPSTPHPLKRTYDVFYTSRTPKARNSQSQDDGLLTSPIPADHQELRCFVEAFAQAKSLDENEIEVVFNGLQLKDYSPDGLDVISIACIVKLTQLTEGKAAGLIKFAREWNKKMERKRVKLA